MPTYLLYAFRKIENYFAIFSNKLFAFNLNMEWQSIEMLCGKYIKFE